MVGFIIAILFSFVFGTIVLVVVFECEVQECVRVEELDCFKSKFFVSIMYELKMLFIMILVLFDLMIDGDLGPVMFL